jgi:recombination protein RecA
MALKYYASQRIDVRKSKHLDGEKDGPANGLKIKAKVVKNKVGPPAGVVLFDVIFAKGVDRTGCLIDAAVAMQTAERKGAFYYFVKDGEEVRLGQGRDKAIAFLEDEANAELRAELEAATKEALTPGQMLPDALAVRDSIDEPEL